jgi:hypothetical protein
VKVLLRRAHQNTAGAENTFLHNYPFNKIKHSHIIMKQIIYHSSNGHKVQYTSHCSRTTHEHEFNNDTQHII